MNSKVLLLDVDGTLIDYDANCPASAKEAVDKARAAGHKVFICTGCSKAEIAQRDLPRLDGMIGGNGGYVEYGGEVLLDTCLSPEQVKAITDWCDGMDTGYYLECNSGIYCNRRFLELGPDVMVKYSLGKGKTAGDAKISATSFMNIMTPVEGDALVRDDVKKISYILRDPKDHDRTKAQFAGLENNTWGGKGALALFGDIGPAGITKQNAAGILFRRLGCDLRDTIAFGDARIDLSMFDACGKSVAMGNAEACVKEAADLVTADVNEDGLYKAFETLGLF